MMVRKNKQNKNPIILTEEAYKWLYDNKENIKLKRYRKPDNNKIIKRNYEYEKAKREWKKGLIKKPKRCDFK